MSVYNNGIVNYIGNDIFKTREEAEENGKKSSFFINVSKIEKINIYERYDMLPIKKISDININGKEIIDILSLKDKSKVKIIQNDIVKRIIK